MKNEKEEKELENLHSEVKELYKKLMENDAYVPKELQWFAVNSFEIVKKK